MNGAFYMNHVVLLKFDIFLDHGFFLETEGVSKRSLNRCLRATGSVNRRFSLEKNIHVISMVFVMRCEFFSSTWKESRKLAYFLQNNIRELPIKLFPLK